MGSHVLLNRVADLTDTENAAARALSLAVYPPEQWADWPGGNLEWAVADWCVRVVDRDGILVSYTGVVLREATHNGQPVRIGGVGGVKTDPRFRRRGYAAAGMQRAVEFFHEQTNVAFALLVCEPHLIDYYARLGWNKFGGRLLVTQHGAVTEFTFNRVMTNGIESTRPADGTIDLRGPPW